MEDRAVLEAYGCLTSSSSLATASFAEMIVDTLPLPLPKPQPPKPPQSVGGGGGVGRAADLQDEELRRAIEESLKTAPGTRPDQPAPTGEGPLSLPLPLGFWPFEEMALTLTLPLTLTHYH